MQVGAAQLHSTPGGQVQASCPVILFQKSENENAEIIDNDKIKIELKQIIVNITPLFIIILREKRV